MALLVRPAVPADALAPGLLYASSAPYYDAFAGSAAGARQLLEDLWEHAGHTASVERCHVAVRDGVVVGALAAFPTLDGDALARRFLRLALPRLGLRRLPAVTRHLRASGRMMPLPPSDALYVDSLAVHPDARRQGVATALLAQADALARAQGLRAVALDTGLENAGGQALYDAAGFTRTGERRAPDERTARIVGGTGFVSFVRPV